MSNICKMCGTSNGDEQKFCAACGSPFEGAKGGFSPAVAPSSAKPAVHKTMLGSVQVPIAAQNAAAVAQVAAAPRPSPAPVPVAPASPSKPAAKTVFGVPAVVVPSAAKVAESGHGAQVPMAKPVSAPPATAAGKGNRTVIGLPMVGADALPRTTTPVSSDPGPSASSELSSDSSPIEAVPKVASPEPPASAPTQAVPSPRQATRQLDPVTDARNWDDEDDDDEESPGRDKRGGGVGLLVVGIAAVALIVVGAVLIYLLLFRGGGTLSPQLFPSADGKSLTVVLNIKDAPVGAAVEVQGRAAPVVGGQARFDFPRDGLSLGENAMPIVYRAPGKSPETMTIPIFVRYTATTDLAGLATADPFFLVQFQVAEGVQLAVNGQVARAVGGVFTMKVPLSQVSAAVDQQVGDALLHKIPFQISGGGGVVEQGQHLVSIPVTKLRVDRPAHNSIVDADSVTCAGIVDEGAVVTVNGAPIGVTAAGFRATVPLPAVGVHTVKIEARAPGKAPRAESVAVTRIQSFDASIEAWSADLDKKLGYPTLARDPNLAVGKKIALSGRIVNISTERGVTAFLLYVGDGCPAGAKCAAYVAFRGETDAGLQSMVDVYGKVRGTWDAQLEGGGRETLPAVDAEFVLPREATTSPKKRSAP